ncbi:hypothetical protein HDU76_006943 [Blyttiomyces sp. JEL0837]|nr:hypothetical protein HDU76_006943 [Blyttiomyces sp. JEL0837]
MANVNTQFAAKVITMYEAYKNITFLNLRVAGIDTEKVDFTGLRTFTNLKYAAIDDSVFDINIGELGMQPLFNPVNRLDADLDLFELDIVTDVAMHEIQGSKQASRSSTISTEHGPALKVESTLQICDMFHSPRWSPDVYEHPFISSAFDNVTCLQLDSNKIAERLGRINKTSMFFQKLESLSLKGLPKGISEKGMTVLKKMVNLHHLSLAFDTFSIHGETLATVNNFFSTLWTALPRLCQVIIYNNSEQHEDDFCFEIIMGHLVGGQGLPLSVKRIWVKRCLGVWMCRRGGLHL